MSGPLFVDRVKETTTTTGTDPFTLLGAAGGFQSFAVIGNNNSCFYCAANNSQFEIGVGTYTASGTTLSRDAIISSSNANAAVSFAAGVKDVFCVMPAEAAVTHIGTTAPARPFPGKKWWKSDEGVLKIYYFDGTSSNWIDASPGAEGPQGPIGLTGADGNIALLGALLDSVNIPVFL